MKKEHTHNIDYLKAFASIMVVVHHAIVYFDFQHSNSFLNAILVLVKEVHVPLFFCIAGYLCHQQDIKKFYIKKVQRILVPFITFTFLKLVYTNLISDTFAHASTVPLQIFDAFVCGSLYWFVYAILIMYIISPLLWKLRRGNVVLFVALLVINTILTRAEVNLGNILQLNDTLLHLCYFVAGIIIQQNEHILRNLKKYKIPLFIVCLSTTALILFLCLTKSLKLTYSLNVIFAFAQMYLLYTFANTLPANISVLNYVGKHSLQVMFFDSFYKVVLFALFPTVGPLSIWLIIAANIILTCISTLILRRIPYVRFLFGL